MSKADNSADGRFSGTNKGCAVAHITPEAADGGPLAVVKKGDLIEIDIPNEKLNILISFEKLQKRLDAWEAPQMRTEKGYLSIYSKMANSADNVSRSTSHNPQLLFISNCFTFLTPSPASWA
jgi:dihydroxyacid dehydratase/phosphogluconate dehydratase